MQDLTGRVAVVTGGASGIGRGMCKAFAGAGMRIMVADLDAARVEATVSELREGGAEAAGTTCNVAQLEDVEALAQSTLDTYGAVHVLCNNAGIGIPTPTANLKLEDWRWIIDVDLWGPIYGVKVFLPLIEAQGEGHINATSSMAGLIASGVMGAYNVAKHGVVALMATLERDLRGRDSPVHASVLCPGPINTDISRHSVEYRPSRAKPASEGASAGKVARGIQDMLSKGMDPNEVGQLVLDAIRTDRFWVLTHPRMSRWLDRQLQALESDGSLTKG